ncbi:MAG: hypothetical protein QOK24_313 [Verrucomicrobiota bacterium]|jgi:hypothetical protein
MIPLARIGALSRNLLGALFSAPESGRSLALLRIGIGIALLAKLCLEFRSILTLYGELGLIQWEVAAITAHDHLPDLRLLASIFSRFGINANTSVYIVFAIYAFSLICLILGFLTRLSAAVAWICLLAACATAMASAYGVDAFGIIGLFYCVVMPVSSCWALTPQRIGTAPWATSLSIRFVQLHLCVVYLASGYFKMRGSQWWTGEAMWRVLRMPEFRQYDLGWLSNVPLVFVGMSWFTLLIETGYPLMIWHRTIGRAWFICIIMMHAGIAIFMGLWVFSAAMIVLNVSAFYLYHFGSLRLNRDPLPFGRLLKWSPGRNRRD